MTTHDDTTARLLREALAVEAADVQPDPQALHAIQQRTSPARSAFYAGATRRNRSRQPSWVFGALGAAVATAAVITAIVMIGDRREPRVDLTPAATNKTQPGLPGHTPSRVKVAVTYVGRPAPGRASRLYTVQQTTSTSRSRALAALDFFFCCEPRDSDYSAGWPPGIKVSGITSLDGLTQIDLKGPVEAPFSPDPSLGARSGELALQAFMRTAGLQPGDRGTVSFNGNPVSVILGVHLPVTVKADDDVLAPVSIDSPAQGQTVDSPVTVTGSANVFEASVNWELLDGGGQVVDSGNAMAGFTEWKPFTVDLGTLDSGSYTIRAFESSPEDGHPTYVDDKTFTVR